MDKYEDPYEQGLHALKEITIYWRNAKDSDRNEATTRLHLINRLIFECLGWDETDAKLEVAQGTEYTDYELYLGRRVLIIEAKKEGKYFKIQLEKKRIEYSIKSLINNSENLKEAVEQVATYCQRRGVEVGVVCNGHQLVAFLATRSDGMSPLEGKALVFPSIDFMKDHFIDLWEALSKDGIANKKLQKRLLSNQPIILPPKLSSKLRDYPGNKGRNPFETDLQIIADLILEDLSGKDELGREFLEQCYSPSGALSQYSYASKQILNSRYAALFDGTENAPTVLPAVTKDGVSEELLTGTISDRPVLLIGDVGVGKTTFIHYLRKIEAVSELDDAITLYIDLGSEATLSNKLSKYILFQVKSQLHSEYDIDVEKDGFVRVVYHSELKRFETTIWGKLKETDSTAYLHKEIEFLNEKIIDTDLHMREAIKFIAKSHRRQVVIFLDNCDQRSDTIQQEAFLAAQEFAKQWGAAVFLTLRPETYHASARQGALTGYHPKAFSIAPPRVDRVIEARLQFAARIANGELRIKALPKNIEVTMPKLSRIIQIFLHSLKINRELVEFIDNISGGDIRLALSLTNSFFGSGHVDMQKILDRDEVDGPYCIPLHEFMRTVTYGDAEYYNPVRSPIANIFDVEFNMTRDHFTVPFLIGILSKLSETGQDGFVNTSDVYHQMQGYGFTSEQIDSGIARGVKHYRTQLIETTARKIPILGQEMPPALRATSIGLYHVQKLCRLFTYLDAIVVDLPIFDRLKGQHINDEYNIEDRLSRASQVQLYLNEAWDDFRSSLPTSEILPFNWEDVSQDLTEDINRVWSGHKRNLSRQEDQE